ncbi:MAG: AraC family transcriptional regulator [Prevotella shahii]|nr:AraC family transcriptional regulator [Hoylesella shahii]
MLPLKIKKAKNLLVNNPQMSLGEVADKCGFNDYSNFVRAFKTVAGVTPTNYRRENCP